MIRRDEATISAGLLLGCGIGASADAIALQQALRWHDLLLGGIPPIDLVALTCGTAGDGVFQACAWLATAAGAWRLWTATRGEGRPSGRALAGAVLVGWGVATAVAAAVDGRLVDGPGVGPTAGTAAWTAGVSALGVALAAAGLLLLRRGAVVAMGEPRAAGDTATNPSS